jgi:uncharacterized protein (DUF433 family)
VPHLCAFFLAQGWEATNSPRRLFSLSDAEGSAVVFAVVFTNLDEQITFMQRRYYRGDAMDDRITIEPGKRSGQPCIRGLRVTVSDVLGWLAAGMNEEEILADYPYLEHEDIIAAVDYASRMNRPIALRSVIPSNNDV